MQIDFSNITGLLKTLSWNKLLQAATLLILIVAAFGFWDNRTVIYNSIKVGARVETGNSLILQLSDSTKTQLDSSVLKVKALVAGVQILNVDFKRNTTSTAYFAFGNDDLKRAYTSSESTRLGDSPLFSSNETGNQKVINLINGEFVCYDFKEISTDILFPSAIDKIKTVCAISIPPYYGRFSGFMNIYLYKVPSTEEYALIRQLARDISLKVYETDVDKSSTSTSKN